jgi:autotransporter adhesin
LGLWASATGTQTVAVGQNSWASGEQSTVVGSQTTAYGDMASVFGYGADSTGVRATAIGAGAITGGDGATALGGLSLAGQTGGTALGSQATAYGVDASSMGFNAIAYSNNSVALGANSYSDRENTVSVGGAGAERQITYVAAGTEDTDAVNVAQLNQAVAGAGNGAGEQVDTLGNTVAQALGGGAAMGAGGLMAPSYSIQGGTYNNVGDAFSALDGALSGALQSINTINQEIAQLPQGGSGQMPTGSGNGLALGNGSVAKDSGDTALGNGATIGADNSTAVGSKASVSAAATNSVAFGEGSSATAASSTALGQGASATAANSVALGQGSVADQANTVSVGSASNQRRVTNVAAGTADTDAANVGQVDEALQTAKTYADTGDKATLNTAKAYTDSKLGNTVSSSDFDAFRSKVNDQFHAVDQRLDRVGAMGTAMAQMTANTSGLSGDNRVGVGAGNYGGESAISVGYQRAFKQNRASFSIGASVSGSESTVGVGGGYSW